MSFDTELFTHYWHLVGHRQELANPNVFVKFDTPLGDLVVFNDEGTLIAFDNKCPHRGARIYAQDFGQQPYACGYHGWSYRNGEVIIPNPAQFAACTTGKPVLNTYHLDWCGDFLFVGITPLTSLAEQLGGLVQTLEDISFNIASRADFNRYAFECAWPIAIENALEPYHIPLIHTQTLATLGLAEGENIFDGCNSVWHAPVTNTRIAKQLVGLKRLFNIDYQREEYLSIFLFPFSMISSTFGYSYSLQNYFPGRDLSQTYFTSRLYSVPAASDNAKKMVEPFLTSSAKVNRQVFEEDHAVCKTVAPDAWTMDPLPFASTLESKIVHFREQCRAFVTLKSDRDVS